MKGAQKLVALLAVLVAVGIVASGCGTREPQIIEKVVTKEVPVEVTRVVEKVVTKDVPKEVTRVVERVVTKEVPVQVTRVVEKEKLVANLLQLHRTAGEVDPALCMGCHEAVLKEVSLSPDVSPPHPIHLEQGLTCTFCHKSVDWAQGSAASLRRQVDPSLCAGCHSSGEHKFYQGGR